MAKFIQRITLVSLEKGGGVVLYKGKKRKKRKVSKWLKPQERLDRRMIESLDAYGGELRKRHNRSNRKRRNGWLRDAPLNVTRAHRKAFKKLLKR